MANGKPTSSNPAKPSPVFPAPEWTRVSSSLAASLAHEIRNPLLSIKGAAQLLEQAVGEEDQALARLIISEAARIETLIATMDPLTPNPAQSMVRLNIHEITEYVRQAAGSFAPGITLVTQYDPSLPEVRAQREALIQALINLVKNAVEAVSPRSEMLGLTRHPGQAKRAPGSPEAHCTDSELFEEEKSQHVAGDPGIASQTGMTPQITITTRYLAGERMQRPDGARLNIQLSVTDNGPGVEPALVPLLFTPFNSSKEGGKGLGLAITAKIIEEHGGLIAYDPVPGGGARFSIYLPVAE